MITVRIDAGEFVRDLQSSMDDGCLMAKHFLTPGQLQRLFRQLIDMDLISEKDLAIRSNVSASQITRAFVESQKEFDKIS